MDDIILSPNEEKELVKLHKTIKEKRLADRVKSIILLGSGHTHRQVAKILLLDEKTICRYKALYNAGLDHLLKWEYKGKTTNLSPEQEKELRDHLENHLYATSKEITAYIKIKYNVDFTCDGLVITLHRLGFSYKKTKSVPCKADRKKQKAFVKEYKELRKNLKADEKIYFIDGVHPTHNTMPAHGWIKTGTEKEVKSNTGRKRININGVYSPVDQEVIVRDDERINSQSTIELFKMIESKHPELAKIYIYSDNAKYYYSKLVRKHLANSRIELIPLPTYSPNLNLIERLWKLFKKNVIYNKYYEKFDQFKNAVFDFFENKIHTIKPELKSLMRERFHLVNAS